MADVNELAVAGWWFYGAADYEERASLYCSYGLLTDAPEPPTVEGSGLMRLSTDLSTH